MRTLIGVVVAALLLVGPAQAGIAKIKGLHDDHERIEPLIKAPMTKVEGQGTVFAVIGGDYGFTLYDASGGEVVEYEDSQEAVGLILAPGSYRVIPSIDDDLHHHQFIEILVKTD